VIPPEVRASAATLGEWCRQEAERLRGGLRPSVSRVLLLYDLVSSVCDLFLRK